MILLDYIPYMFLAAVLGALFALIAKILYEHKDARLSLVLSLCGFMVLIFPIVLYKAIKKHRTSLIQEVNKNSSLTEAQKKEARKIISTNSSLFLFVCKFTLVNYRMIIKIFTELNYDKFRVDKTDSMRDETTRELFRIETETALLKNLTKPLESFLSRSLA